MDCSAAKGEMGRGSDHASSLLEISSHKSSTLPEMIHLVLIELKALWCAVFCYFPKIALISQLMLLLLHTAKWLLASWQNYFINR